MSISAAVLLLSGIGAATYALTRPETKPVQTSQDAPKVSYQATSKIVFRDDGFSQESYTFAEGSTVTVDNQSSSPLQFSSDNHPAHTDEPKLNMPTIESGKTGILMPPAKGTYGFHDHLNDQFKGALVIE
ncbi:cupredoxin domain-containing protein [Candidatus Saccharibacteria bacterium]|nr:cupredoxin domain-containing protein [Candidatus Saccharibacteria bacterium]